MALTISARDLGYFATSHYCARCAWVKLHVKPLPFQSFPGIFSSIDRYNKLIVHSFFDREKRLPRWLDELGEVESYVPPPHWRRYSILDPETGTTLRGEADGIFRMADGSHTIVDYKTARHTPGQLALFDLYEAQLNSYAYIGERLELSPVTQLALIYMEPMTEEEDAQESGSTDSAGFSMGFKATIVPVELKPEKLIPPLLKRATEIFELDNPPVGRKGCRDCEASLGLISALHD